jgi:hypothetical protein
VADDGGGIGDKALTLTTLNSHDRTQALPWGVPVVSPPSEHDDPCGRESAPLTDHDHRACPAQPAPKFKFSHLERTLAPPHRPDVSPAVAPARPAMIPPAAWPECPLANPECNDGVLT